MTSYGMEYPLGQFGSAVLAVIPSQLPMCRVNLAENNPPCILTLFTGVGG